MITVVLEFPGPFHLIDITVTEIIDYHENWQCEGGGPSQTTPLIAKILQRTLPSILTVSSSPGHITKCIHSKYFKT